VPGPEWAAPQHDKGGQEVRASTPYALIAYTIVRLVEYLESEPDRLKAKADAQKAKLEALERKLGIEPPSKTGTPVAGSSKASGSGEDPPVLAGRKHRFDDTEYLEQSRDLVDGVKSAVSAGMVFCPIGLQHFF
jgi:hypothetical protein